MADYLRNNCDSKGTPQLSDNLSREEAEGRDQILRGIKERDWVLYSTDKSGKLVLDTKTNYLQSIKPHFKSEIPSNMEEVAASERILNAHTKS